MSYNAGQYDVAIVGGGHAGCEAALAAARLGMKTIMFAINLDSIAMMPCNPSIGGTSKGHLVREIDALGGEMGRNIDKTYIQTKLLNTGKGPAVYSLRAQADKHKYSAEMKHTLEKNQYPHPPERGYENLRGGRQSYRGRDLFPGVLRRQGSGPLHGNLPEGALSFRRNYHIYGSQRLNGRQRPEPEPSGSGHPPVPLQNRHSRKGPAVIRRLFKAPAPSGRRGDTPLLFREYSGGYQA